MAGLGSAHQFRTLRQPLQRQGCLLHHLGGGRVRSPAELDEFMVRSLKVPKGVIRLIVGFIAVDACVKHPFLAESCCYQNSVSMKRYILKDAQSIYGIIFLISTAGRGSK